MCEKLLTLSMSNRMATKQFAIMFPSDEIWDVVEEMGDFMNIPIDEEELEKAVFEEDFDSPNNIAKFYDPNDPDNLIVAYCCNNDIFYYLLVRIVDARSELVKRKMLEIDTKIRSYSEQRIQNDLLDYTYNPDRGLNLLEKKYNITF